ncbi:transcription-repair coupling factor [Mesorhizobium sp. M1C.F.Ca.ET.193.01.1.1]|uniref:transcription-repair coupling factor n=1 Tax=unclassified Mesorhizobium TaxID=325217 RepID=UPI000FD4814B|nr:MULTISPECIES: transcription-repair coupling factor [unclassified Mesorhizobium]TGT00595.1 transcription-repair coupling factor [bacterium M00.F.Ca.ET.177.01.1.1]TGQ54010.1 transcription-repair coupling factor [Mesorhizobium sp. M1C.F.Ca.ET.210.01.1.1]TGQ72031.1 transcription-repair coupling factor [Mesorhizobium sp. M1C.F.Ca.ET.212.01.1.1]TGR08756.1 transcription-repair coupling factor [Mesorhizobium sp. M1C.F.Ca.ET.204.01.1.1]TGR29492.1 transcription-repair coupling factor [Mesorhizobium s
MSLIPSIGLPKGRAGQFIVDGVADGYEAFALVRTAHEIAPDKPVLFVARDGQRLPAIIDALAFAAPGLPVLELPAWDCLPYDRVSPGADAAARRLDALSAIIALARKPHRAVILTTANALLQRIPPAGLIEAQTFHAKPGNQIDMNVLIARLENSGFERVPTVRDVGEFAVRGGILDLFAPGWSEALRLDFFGDTLESIRVFDVATQRTTGQRKSMALQAMSEVALTPETISRFRRSYIEAFGAPSRDDALYAAVSEGRRFAGMEHWLPFFYERLETVFDYLPDAPVVFDHLAHEALAERHTLILDHYEARRKQADAALKDAVPYKPVAPDLLYLSPENLKASLGPREDIDFTVFDAPDVGAKKVFHAGSRHGRSFAEERADPNTNVFDVVVKHIAEERAARRRVIVAGWTEGSLDRLGQILAEHHLGNLKPVATLAEVEKLEPGQAGLAVLPLESGFETDSMVVVAEQDILGDRLIRRSKRKKKASDFIAEASSLSSGDIVVHADHGIGRFVGLRTIEAVGAPHDCLEIHYAGDDRLFLPVENIELLSRYGSDSAEAPLDKLGGGAWQARKARLKRRLLDMAGQLIRIAAERQMRAAPSMIPAEGIYGEFAARFPYEETDDQQTAIDSVMDDLGAGKPMDRLVCGDVGFGKTEVALRAAFIAAMEGFQVAVVVPTTLLSRQHFKTFSQRFSGLPIQIAQASRLVGAKELAETKKGIADGTVDIVVGTHALLGSSISFKNLGLLIIDEEQHFGVKHKERLKELKNDVHVLTLSATPIPRTLQLALTGVRELSLIATPPVDRMAVRTFISPFDPLVIRETLLRERYRGGHSFYVVPRISDLSEIHDFLRESVPELKIAVAHGQMPPGELDDIMNAFYDGQYDVLLSTTIVESGLDIPTANTLIIHRADMFGLAQLYQLRGRVGRSKVRAYALFTLPANRKLTDTAERRLKVLQSLDTLGAGFQLASHDLDIRGAGNLLGEEQSGHIKEVGFELYQQMLEEAVAEVKDSGEVQDGGWSPQIAVGTAVMIPESYVPDLQLRMALYRRLGDLETTEEIDGFGAELIDRFGPLPEEVTHLLKIVFIKALCRRANVEKLDAGPKGVVIHFRKREFPNPVGLVKFIGEQGSLAKIRADHSVVFIRDWPNAEKRLAGSAVVMTQLARLVDKAA